MDTTALYNALIKAGVSQDDAGKAVGGLISADDAVTRVDTIEIKAGIAGLKADILDLKTSLLLAIVLHGIGTVSIVALLIKL